MKHKIPLLVSIPHSGLKIPPPAYWLKNLDPLLLMCDVDAYVDELYRPALKGIPTVVFEWHRYAVDANRHPEDISPATVKGVDSQTLHKLKHKKSPSDIHWHKTTKGDLLIKKALPFKLHKTLIEKYFNPYHKKIKKQIEDFKKLRALKVYILDLHSMPSKGLDFHKDPGCERPEVVISDREGRSCCQDFTDLVIKAYQKAGFKTKLNWPYKGGAIIQNYGQPKKNQHALQIELNRALYMDEITKTKNKNYQQIKAQLLKAITFITQYL